MLKLLFEYFTGFFAISDNPIVNYLGMGLIGAIAFRVARKSVGWLYDNWFITGKESGSRAHWIIRTIVFVAVFCLFATIINFLKWIASIPKYVWYIVMIVLALAVVGALLIKYIFKNKVQNDKGDKKMLSKDFDVDKVFQERLATSMGLDKYQYIMDYVRQTDVSTDMEFQRIFNGFYIVRRNAEWRKCFYGYFEKAKESTPFFDEIITYLYENTGYIEPSFSSKMLATLAPEKPIWDKYVVQNLDMTLEGKTKQEKLESAIKLYHEMEEWYSEFLTTDKARECIKKFDETFPDYKWISEVKKIDVILWSIR